MKKIKDVICNLINNKILMSIIMAIFTYFIMCREGIIMAYDTISWFIFFSLIMLYFKTDIYNKKYKKDILIFSLIFSFILVFGKIVYNLQSNADASVFIELLTIRSLIAFVGFFNLLYVILTNVFPKICDYKIKKDIKPIKDSKKIFIISFVIILLCWLPYFLRFFPGTLSPDSLSELKTIISNFEVVSDHHPVIHMLFISIPYNLGVKIFGSMTAGVALATITQMLIMASIFSALIVFLKNRNINKYILLIVLVYYALVPMHGFYSVVMWKDIIFSGTLLVLTMETVKILEKIDNLKFKNMTSFIVASIFCVFFRNNAVYMYMVLAVLTFVLFRKQIKYFLGAFIIVFGVYFIVKGPIFSYFNVMQTESAEYIGMPLQQIGRMAFKGVEFNEYETEELNKLMPLDIMKVSYNPQVSDGIKFNKNYDSSVFDENKGKYLKIWAGLVVKHPSTATEAYMTSTLGYWYPGVVYWSIADNIWENDLGLEIKSKLPESTHSIFRNIESRGMPILNIQWSIGLCFWIILIFGYVTKKKKGIIYLYPYIPVFGIWLTMMIASPVYAEFRYVYGAFTCLPLLMLIPYIKFKNSKGNA